MEGINKKMFGNLSFFLSVMCYSFVLEMLNEFYVLYLCFVTLTLHYYHSVFPISFERRVILFNKYKFTENSSLSEALYNLDCGTEFLQGVHSTLKCMLLLKH